MGLTKLISDRMPHTHPWSERFGLPFACTPVQSHYFNHFRSILVNTGHSANDQRMSEDLIACKISISIRVMIVHVLGLCTLSDFWKLLSTVSWWNLPNRVHCFRHWIWFWPPHGRMVRDADLKSLNLRQTECPLPTIALYSGKVEISYRQWESSAGISQVRWLSKLPGCK